MRTLIITLILASVCFGQSASETFCTEVLRLYPTEFFDQDSWWATCLKNHDLDYLMGLLDDPLIKVADSTELSEVYHVMNSISTTGYLRITGFYGGDRFIALFDSILETARSDAGLVLDLKGAGGGEIETAYQVMARFTNGPIEGVRVQKRLPGEQRTKEVYYRIKPRGDWQYDEPVVILVDQDTYWPSQVILWAARERTQMESVGVPTKGTKAVEPRVVSLPGHLKMQIPTATVTTQDNVKMIGQPYEPDVNLNHDPPNTYREPHDPILYRGTDELYRIIGRLEWLREELRKQEQEKSGKPKTGK